MNRSPSMIHCRFLSAPAGLLCLAALSVAWTIGCNDDTDTIRKIQAQRQVRLQTQTKVDHLGEVFSLLNQYVELNAEKAKRQITYHLNQWREEREFESPPITPLTRTFSEILAPAAAEEWIGRENFASSDVEHLRDAYLFRQIVEWVDREQGEDPLLTDWLSDVEAKLSENEFDSLRTAIRLFDWTIRNIAFEPLHPTASLPPHPPIPGGMPQPPLPFGMKFQGPGYRQTDYQTLWHGTGDSLQRSGVFIQLCRQASIPAFVLAFQSVDRGSLDPWCVGVLIGEDIYLFEPELGIFVPGPGQIGIATLAEARKDASVLRRLNVAGFFDYPLSKSDIQQCTALLNVTPEAISPRMWQLESGLTGDRRMKLFVDADSLEKRIDAVSGIAGVRLWKVPLLAKVYEQQIDSAAKRDPVVMFWSMSAWAILEAPIGASQQLSLARWRHLNGQFDNDDEEDTKGARVLYLQQRSPEFEIDDLLTNVDLQQAYGVRRELGMDQKVYEMQLQQAQKMMRMGKRTATYWISLIQYDDARYDTAETWFSKRVLDEQQQSYLAPAARYNLARSLERLGKSDEAIEIYKTEGDPQEHGNRIRARLLAKGNQK